MMIQVRVPHTGHSPALSILPAPKPGEVDVDVEFFGDNPLTLTLRGCPSDLFDLFTAGKGMLEAFIFGPESRLSAPSKPAGLSLENALVAAIGTGREEQKGVV
jgi:hypothetical protein